MPQPSDSSGGSKDAVQQQLEQLNSEAEGLAAELKDAYAKLEEAAGAAEPNPQLIAVRQKRYDDLNGRYEAEKAQLNERRKALEAQLMSGARAEGSQTSGAAGQMAAINAAAQIALGTAFAALAPFTRLAHDLQTATNDLINRPEQVDITASGVETGSYTTRLRPLLEKRYDINEDCVAPCCTLPCTPLNVPAFKWPAPSNEDAHANIVAICDHLTTHVLPDGVFAFPVQRTNWLHAYIRCSPNSVIALHDSRSDWVFLLVEIVPVLLKWLTQGSCSPHQLESLVPLMCGMYEAKVPANMTMSCVYQAILEYVGVNTVRDRQDAHPEGDIPVGAGDIETTWVIHAALVQPPSQKKLIHAAKPKPLVLPEVRPATSKVPQQRLTQLQILRKMATAEDPQQTDQLQGALQQLQQEEQEQVKLQREVLMVVQLRNKRPRGSGAASASTSVDTTSASDKKARNEACTLLHALVARRRDHVRATLHAALADLAGQQDQQGPRSMGQDPPSPSPDDNQQNAPDYDGSNPPTGAGQEGPDRMQVDAPGAAAHHTLAAQHVTTQGCSGTCSHSVHSQSDIKWQNDARPTKDQAACHNSEDEALAEADTINTLAQHLTSFLSLKNVQQGLGITQAPISLVPPSPDEYCGSFEPVQGLNEQLVKYLQSVMAKDSKRMSGGKDGAPGTPH